MYFLQFIGDIKYDDIINSLSSYTGPELQIEEFNLSYPFYFERYKTEIDTIPGRYMFTNHIYDFLQANILDKLDGGKFYLETKSSIEYLDLNQIHIIFKDSTNKKILDCPFQDFYTGILIPPELKNDYDDQSFLSMLLNFITPTKHNDYGKIKNE